MVDATDVIAIGLFALVVALFVPQLVDGTQDNTESTIEIENDTLYSETERLDISPTDVSSVGSNATIEVTNSQTLNASEKLLNVSESKSYVLDSENVTVTLNSIRSDSTGQYVTVTVAYPTTFGFGEGAQLFFEQLEFIIVAVGFIIVMGILAVVIKQ